VGTDNAVGRADAAGAESPLTQVPFTVMTASAVSGASAYYGGTH
jgi:hypothetical protein